MFGHGFSFSLGALLGSWSGFAVVLLVVAFFLNQWVPMQRNNLNGISKYRMSHRFWAKFEYIKEYPGSRVRVQVLKVGPISVTHMVPC